jgi:hypothetical protein
MSQDRIVFVPWNENQAGNFKNETESADSNRGATHHKRRWTGVYLDSAGEPLKRVGFGMGARIHIAGHGAIGDPNIYADHGTGGATRSYTEVVDAMIAKGLQKYYLGTIVCDVCYSALGNPPFAKLLAKELWTRGFKGTCVLGYKGSLYATYNNFGSGKKYTHRTVLTDAGDEQKSSDLQERFFGFV